MQISLHKKTALICGSTQGIGWAIAEKLAHAGANCILLARDENRLREMLAKLPVIFEDQHHHYLVADLSDIKHVQTTTEKFIGFGTIHILINNSGGPRPGPVTDAKPEDFLAAYTQHILSAQLMVQSLLDGMKKEGYGRIINIVSTSVRIPIANLGVSNTTRGAMASWAKTLSNEVAQFGITVNNILPGLTETQRLSGLISAEAIRLNKTEEEIAHVMRMSIPARRFAQPEELANLACFLASAESSYINGTSIAVDGGKTGSI